MAEFMSGLQFLRPSSYSSFSFLEMDSTMDLLDNSNLSFHFNHNNNPIPPIHSIPFCNETNLFFPHELPSQPQNMIGVVPVGGGGTVCQDHGEVATGGRLAGGEAGDDGNCYGNNKRKKSLEFSQGSCSASASANSSDPAKRRKHGSVGKGRKTKVVGEEDGGKKEVVHVRARRGQATDSHSLAERVRRGKINEKLRCLQDIVPGCYKTMGLAVMLDEIINYVHSLQLQVEFLSMKLTAASSSYDFNAGSDAIEAMQVKVYEAKELEKLLMRSQLEAQSTNTTSNLQSAFHHPFDHSL